MRSRPSGLQTCIKIMHETLGIGKTETSTSKKRKKHERVKRDVFYIKLFRIHLIQLKLEMKLGKGYLVRMQPQNK